MSLVTFKHVAIAGLAYVDPPNRVTSLELEQNFASTLERLGLRPGFIEKCAGIVARRFWDTGTLPSDMAAEAAARCLEKCDVAADKLGIIVNSSVSKDYIEPSVASIVSGKLGLPPSCLNFDITNACLGFLNAMQVVATMIDRGDIDYGMVVNCEDTRHIVSKTIERFNREACDEDTFRRNFTTLTLGSGAVAMLLCRRELCETAHPLELAYSMGATKHHQLCTGQVDSMLTDTIGLFMHSFDLIKSLLFGAMKGFNWNPDERKELVIHQVNKIHTRKFLNMIKTKEEKVYCIYPEFGNVGPATIPLSLAKSAEAGRLQRGDRFSLMGIASGLNSAILDAVW